MPAGACLCGAVSFEIDCQLPPIQICHCGDCRRAQGSAFATNIPVPAKAFQIRTGSEMMRAYESSPGKERVFCARCGSPIFSRSTARPDTVRVRAGSLELPLGAPLGFHIHTGSAAGWWPILDDLPRYPGAGPST